MRHWVGCQPLGDVLVVGGGPALVGAVGRQPRREAGRAAQAQQKAYFGSGVSGLLPGRVWSRRAVRMTELIELVL